MYLESKNHHFIGFNTNGSMAPLKRHKQALFFHFAPQFHTEKVKPIPTSIQTVHFQRMHSKLKQLVKLTEWQNAKVLWLRQTNSESIKKKNPPVQPAFVSIQCCHSEAPSFSLVLGIDHGRDGALVDGILTLRSTRRKRVNTAAVSQTRQRQDRACVDIYCVTTGLVKHATNRGLTPLPWFPQFCTSTAVTQISAKVPPCLILMINGWNLWNFSSMLVWALRLYQHKSQHIPPDIQWFSKPSHWFHGFQTLISLKRFWYCFESVHLPSSGEF